MSRFYYFQNDGRCPVMNKVLEKSVPEYLIDKKDKEAVPYYFILDWNVVHHSDVYRDFLRSAGIRFVESIEDLPEGAGIFAGGYGGDPVALEEAKSKGIPLIDKICPWVEFLEEDIRSVPQGYQCVILIDEFHIVYRNFQSLIPENAIIVNEKNFREKCGELDGSKPVFLCVYATFRQKDFDDVKELIENLLPDLPHKFSSRGICSWITHNSLFDEIDYAFKELQLSQVWVICNSEYNRSVLTLINEIEDRGAEARLIKRMDDIPRDLPQSGNIGVIIAPVPFDKDRAILDAIKERFE